MARVTALQSRCITLAQSILVRSQAKSTRQRPQRCSSGLGQLGKILVPRDVFDAKVLGAPMLHDTGINEDSIDGARTQYASLVQELPKYAPAPRLLLYPRTLNF
jgi:hypothetical protein